MDGIDIEAAHYDLEVHDKLDQVDASEWNALLHASPQPTPFMRHEYLAALDRSGSAVPVSGWTPLVIALRQGRRLMGASVGYLKQHSYGEYVFDWAWADAYARHGLAYYPKWLAAVPFTPVPGTRLLAQDASTRRALLRAQKSLAARLGLSSAHVLFMDEADAEAARAEGWMLRSGVQFHWTQRLGQPYGDMADFLAGLQRDKRKKIMQERRRVREAEVSFRILEGPAILETDWDFFYQCYSLTYQAHGGKPYLTRDFFRRVSAALPAHWLLFVAEMNGEPVASSLLAIDRERGVAWGRYWGTVRDIDCLHFEACYYQPLEWCIAHRFQRFEGGAQGEHKMARGLLPVATTSAHWLAHPQFAQAVEDFLTREGVGVGAYMNELRERNPFKGGH
jgi:hypothetical protein